MNNPIDTALILVAGRGRRLEGLTDHLPKCLLPVNHRSILERMLDQLLELRFKTCYLVTGYLQEAVVKQIGHEWKGMTLHYIQNDQWETTNNIVSLEVGVGALTTDFLLIEGDLLVKTELLASILTPNATALCRFAPPMNGTVVELDSEGLVKRFFVSNEDHYPIRPEDYYKTINLYSFDYEVFTKQISPVLQHYLAEGRTHTYYESAIAHAVMQQGFALQAHIFEAQDWAEVDTIDDLRQAERLFG